MNGGIKLENIVVIIAIIPVILFGFYIMKSVDKFLYENNRYRIKEVKIKEPSSVRLSGNLPLMEIDKEIFKFRQNHPDFEIILRAEECSDGGDRFVI